MSAGRAVTIDRMGEGALLVTLGSGISPALNEAVHALADNLRQLQITGVLDVVPAYASVLVTFDDAVAEGEEVAGYVRQALALPGPMRDSAPRRHTIPVVYGGAHGPDLESLSAVLGLSPADLVRRHTGGTYRVYFLGFMPGFAYLGGLDPSIAAPRLESPRVRVPAGSVGIAGEQTGVYPLSSPGGWQLIGRTAVTLWDAYGNPPALLAPRDEVQFVASAGLALSNPTTDVSGELHEPGSVPVFTVESPGALTLVQDLGRAGHSHFGLSPGGAMDALSVQAANLLVGNPPGAAALEITWSGPTLRANSTTVIGLVGSDLACHVDGTPVPCGISWLVRAGSEVRFVTRRGSAGARCYLSVMGGFSVPPVMGSRSTYLPGGFGGYGGRQLRAGDTLFCRATRKPPAEVAGQLASIPPLTAPLTASLRYVPYLGTGSVSAKLRELAESCTYEVGAASDRMGVRLLPEQEKVLAWSGGELTSFGVPRGGIQLPPAGTPVLLGADHQTTGGYPVLGVLTTADWPLLAQLRPGSKVRLQPVTLGDARAARLTKTAM